MKRLIVPTDSRITKVSRITLKEYTKWVFVGWGLIPTYTGQEFSFDKKGRLLVGDERYDLESVKDGDTWLKDSPEVMDALREIGYPIE